MRREEMELELMHGIALEDVMKHVEKELPIYGDFLKFYKINLGVLPVEKETELYKVGELYRRIENIHSGLLDGYITLLMLRKGFIPEAITEEESEHEYEKATKDLIDYLVNEEFSGDMICIEDYVNVQNPNEKIRILTMHARIMLDFCVFIPTRRDIIEKMSNDFKNFLIVDPLLFRCGKEEINSLKEELREKTGENIVYHPDEFSEEMLGIKSGEIEEEWLELREKARKKLYEKYEFLTLYDERGLIQEIEEKMKKARKQFEDNKLEEAIGNAGIACEGMLIILYKKYKKKSYEKKSFAELLNELRREITDEFGEEIYSDLEFLKYWRNRVSHPKIPEISSEDVVKVVRKAELFQELSSIKIKGKL